MSIWIVGMIERASASERASERKRVQWQQRAKVNSSAHSPWPGICFYFHCATRLIYTSNCCKNVFKAHLSITPNPNWRMSLRSKWTSAQFVSKMTRCTAVTIRFQRFFPYSPHSRTLGIEWVSLDWRFEVGLIDWPLDRRSSKRSTAKPFSCSPFFRRLTLTW